MELGGAIAALRHVADRPGPVAIYTDSTYVIQGITQWVWGWRKRGWKTAQGTDVLNRDLWEELSSLTGARPRGGLDWRWVRGHVGTPGNERCDEIAVAFASQRAAGTVRRSVRRLRALDPAVARRHRAAEAARRRPAGAAKSPPYSYLSVVDGMPMRHLTWAECERRVKGQSGARFKKAASATDEASILKRLGHRSRPPAIRYVGAAFRRPGAG